MEVHSFLLILFTQGLRVFGAYTEVTVTDVELANFSEDILQNDINNCFALVSVNLQGSTCFSCTKDSASAPLLTVNPDAYKKPTIAKLLPLLNNYLPSTEQAEHVTSQETKEEADFLDAIMETPAIKKAEKFLTDKGFIPKGANRMREAIHNIWFGLYSRSPKKVLGSSGFEHTFLGEIKDGKVSGFHNWIFYSQEEAKHNVNYKGRIGTVINLGSKGRIIKQKFDWNNVEKQLGTMFIGVSPEFELSVFTVCFYARPGGKCPIRLNGKNLNVTTYYMNRQGKRYVASAYVDI